MGRRTTIAVAVVTCLTVFSCGSKTEDRKSSNDTPAVTDAKKLEGSDKTSLLGQPGTITIIGEALTSETGELNPDQPKKINISARGGIDSDKKQTAVKKDFLVLTKELDTETLGLLEEADRDKTFINIGCDISKRTDLVDLKERKLDAQDLAGIAILNANTILICGKGPIKAAITPIIAKTIILDNLQHNMVGGQESMISIIAREITLVGTNLITSVGKNGKKMLAAGPGITLVAQKLSGAGILQIDSSGSSTVTPEAAPTATPEPKKDTTPETQGPAPQTADASI